jgi:hypothetical protein
MCMKDDSQNMIFYHAKINPNSGYALQLGMLEEDHKLLKEPSKFKINVFEHYTFIMLSKSSDCIPIQVSWPLLESV